jgi:hypothetical protein
MPGDVHSLTPVTLSGTHPVSDELLLPVGAATGNEFNRVRLRLIPKACFRVEDNHFEFDSSFILPFGLTFNVDPLKKLLERHPGSKLSVFGHADPVGRDDYNKTLSGRRAQALYALLVRDVRLWEDLYYDHDTNGKDEWGVRAVQIMLNQVGPTKTGNVSGDLDEQTRQALRDFETGAGVAPAGFNARREVARPTFNRLATLYMDRICVDDDDKDFRLKKTDFLARGAGRKGKGDFQGCGEFNPLLIFSREERARLDRPENRKQRNKENEPNRRVMVLLFRPGSRIDPERWPCPTVKEGVAGCVKRFFSDGERRRSPQETRRTFEEARDDPTKLGTFACRFYERLLINSPCEQLLRTFQIRLYDPLGRFIPLAPCTVSIGERPASRDRADPRGILTLRDVEVPVSCTVRWGFPPKEGEEPVLSFSLDVLLTAGVEAPEPGKPEEARQKLNNLGYDGGELETDIRDFQLDYGHLVTPEVPPTGVLDDRTLNLLREVYNEPADDLRRTEVKG